MLVCATLFSVKNREVKTVSNSMVVYTTYICRERELYFDLYLNTAYEAHYV